MHRVNIDQASVVVKRFLRSLPIAPDGVEIELDGHVVCKVVGPEQLSEEEKSALLRKGWKQTRKSQDRNRRVPAKVIGKEIERAIADVRGKARR